MTRNENSRYHSIKYKKPTRQRLRAIAPLPLPICPYRRKTTAPQPGDHAADSLRAISALSLTVAIPLIDPALVGVSYPRAFPANDLW